MVRYVSVFSGIEAASLAAPEGLVPVMKWIMGRMDEQLKGKQWVAS